MKTKYALLGLLALLMAAACADAIQEEKEKKPAFAPAAQQSAWIEKQLLGVRRTLSIAKDFDEQMYWISMLSVPVDTSKMSAPMDTNALQLLQSLIRLRISEAGAGTAHDGRLYKLYVKSLLGFQQAGKMRQPYDQIVAMATYKPVWLDTADRVPKGDRIEIVMDSLRGPLEDRAVRGADGKCYIEGPLDELFILMRTDEPTIETDAGWIYGVVDAQHDELLQQGLIPSCMGCHRQNAPDRLFGMPK